MSNQISLNHIFTKANDLKNKDLLSQKTLFYSMSNNAFY